MEIITRKEAKARGLMRYFTGKACSRGHVEERRTSTGVCVRCHSAQSRAWDAENREKNRESNRRWRAANPGKAQKCDREWYGANPHLNAAKDARWRTKEPRVVPSWIDQEACRVIYLEARSRGLEVDHIVPLQHPLVCGLHVESNLQPLTRTENRTKGNNHWPNMPE